MFDIDRELLDIFEELEENGGELTPEIEEKLKLNEEEVNLKIVLMKHIVLKFIFGI